MPLHFNEANIKTILYGLILLLTSLIIITSIILKLSWNYPQEEAEAQAEKLRTKYHNVWASEEGTVCAHSLDKGNTKKFVYWNIYGQPTRTSKDNAESICNNLKLKEANKFVLTKALDRAFITKNLYTGYREATVEYYPTTIEQTDIEYYGNISIGSSKIPMSCVEFHRSEIGTITTIGYNCDGFWITVQNGKIVQKSAR
jgi:hypothetical protein